MKTLSIIKSRTYLCFLLGITLLLMFSNCADKDDYHPNCEYYKDEHDSVEKNHYWLLRNHVGDTLWFKVYQVSHDSGKREYHFQREVYFVATDSTVDSLVENVDVTYDPPCEYNRYYYPITIHYQGEGNLRCQIVPFEGEADFLRIVFQKKEFRILADWQYDHIGDGWYESLKIGDHTFYRVNSLPGGIENSWGGPGTIDSTMALYNLDYGILKIIIDDTIAYERALK